MILTPTIKIDKNHKVAFNALVEEFYQCQDKGTRYHGDEGVYNSNDGRYVAVTMKSVDNNILILCDDGSGARNPVLIARIVPAPVPQGTFPWGRKVYVIDRIRVSETHIGMSISPELYLWLTNAGYTLVSDSHQTSMSLAVWRKLGMNGGVFTTNLVDGTWRVYDPLRVEDWMLFGNGDLRRYWPIRFLLPGK